MQTKMWITFFNTIRCVDKEGGLYTQGSTINKWLSTLKKVAKPTKVQVNHRKKLKQQLKSFSTKQERGNLMQLKRKTEVFPKSTMTTLATAFYIYNI